MRRLLLALMTATSIAGTASADIPPRPPKTASTAPKPKLETETAGTTGSSTVFAGVAFALAITTGGLFLARRRFSRSNESI